MLSNYMSSFGFYEQTLSAQNSSETKDNLCMFIVYQGWQQSN